MTTIVEVEADRTVRWRFLQIFAASGFLIFGLIGTALILFSGWPVFGFVVFVAVPTLIATVIGIAVGLYWSWGPGRITYVCDGVNLWAQRGQKIVRSVNCAEIDTWLVNGSLTCIDLVLLSGMPPDLPKLVVDLKDPEYGIRTVSFPEILLWGEDSVREANRKLSEVLGLSEPPQA